MDDILANTNPFNNKIELGLRALTILVSSYPKSYSLRDLVILDYFLVYSRDLSNDGESLHPQVPFRSGELIIKSENLEKGLHLYIHKGLVELKLSNNGFNYKASDSSKYFLDLLSNQYTISLIEKADWLTETLKTFSKYELRKKIEEIFIEWDFDTFIESNLIKDSDDE